MCRENLKGCQEETKIFPSLQNFRHRYEHAKIMSEEKILRYSVLSAVELQVSAGDSQ